MKLITEHIEDVEFIAEAKAEGGKNYFIEGVFLQAELKNRNNRMYPKSVMEREVNRYMKEYVEANRGFGELGHPSCGLFPYRVMTPDGLKDIRDVQTGDEVLSINPETRLVEKKKVINTVDAPYEGDAIAIKFKNKIDLLLTPEHRVLIVNREGKSQFITAEDIHQEWGSSPLAHSYIPKASKNTTKYVPHNVTIGDTEVDFKLFCKFVGIYLAEGYVTKRKGRINSYRIGVCQKKEANLPIIKALLDSLPWKWSAWNNGEWVCHNKDLAEFLFVLGKHNEKYVPSEIIDRIDGESARALVEWFMLGDGRGTLDKKYTKADVFTTSEQLANDLSYLIALAGYVPRLYSYQPIDRLIEGRLIKAENSKLLYFVQIQQKQGVYLDDRFGSTVERIKHKGRKYCLTVEDNGTFMWEDSSGNCHWTGNSPTVNLDRASHKIVSLKEDGNNYIGKAKIMDTPMGKIVKTLLDEGAKLGVSSRGVGTVKANRDGINEVQSDFYLSTAADIVADPSAPDAFVNGIMESAEWLLVDGVWTMRQTEQLQNVIKETPKKALPRIQAEAFEKFMKRLSRI